MSLVDPPPGAACPRGRIAVLGMGHVGSATAAWLLALGCAVEAIEIDPVRLDLLRHGRPPVDEPGIAEALAAGRAAGRLRVTADLAVPDIDMAMLCVGTPGAAEGDLEHGHLLAAVRRLGLLLAARAPTLGPCLVVCRSTVAPGTLRHRLMPELLVAGPPGERWELAVWPEFLREGTALADMMGPARLVLGERLPGQAAALAHLLARIPAPLLQTDFETAELAKLADNAWHATKVGFANELARLAHAQGVPAAALARIFLADARLNLGPAYLWPGLPYGGACLPKDLAALEHWARGRELALPLLDSVAASNRAHADFLLARVRQMLPEPGPILLLGLSFKSGADELRQGPARDLADRLAGLGYRLWAFDPALPACGDPQRVADLQALPERPALILRLRADLAASAAALAGIPLLDLG